MKNIFALIITAIVLAGCSQSPDLNLITKNSIGLLTNTTQVEQLQETFSNDSIVKFIGGDEFTGAINDIEVFDKSGVKLLEVTPRQSLDSTSTIKMIKIIDDRFSTSKGLTAKSTFNTLSDNYEISDIQNTIRDIIITVKELNAFFTIDKKELPAELRFDMNIKIDALQIPNTAKIKGFYLQWQ